MPNDNSNAEAKLRKLGQRIRDGWAKQHPMPEKSVETIRQTVREEWQRERVAKRSAPSPGHSRKPEPPEPER